MEAEVEEEMEEDPEDLEDQEEDPMEVDTSPMDEDHHLHPEEIPVLIILEDPPTMVTPDTMGPMEDTNGVMTSTRRSSRYRSSTSEADLTRPIS